MHRLKVAPLSDASLFENRFCKKYGRLIVNNNMRSSAKTWTNNPWEFHQGIRIPRMDLFNTYEFLDGASTDCLTMFWRKISCCYLRSNVVEFASLRSSSRTYRITLRKSPSQTLLRIEIPKKIHLNSEN